jgi:hypothetical protein
MLRRPVPVDFFVAIFVGSLTTAFFGGCLAGRPRAEAFCARGFITALLLGALAGVVFVGGFFAAFSGSTFLAGDFFATFLAGAFLTTALAGAFLADVSLAGDFVTTFLAGAFVATFLAGAFLTTALAGAFLAGLSLAGDFATFWAGAFLEALSVGVTDVGVDEPVLGASMACSVDSPGLSVRPICSAARSPAVRTRPTTRPNCVAAPTSPLLPSPSPSVRS